MKMSDRIVATANRIINRIRLNQLPNTRSKKRPRDDAFTNLLDDLFIDEITDDPELLSYLNLFETIGLKDHNKHLTEYSYDHIVQGYKQAKYNINRINNFPTDDLTDDQKVYLNTARWMIQHDADGGDFLMHKYVMSQIDGVLHEINFVFVEFTNIKDLTDANNYICRLREVPTKIRQAITFMNLQRQHNIYIPVFAIEKVINMINKFTTENIKENLLYETFNDKIKDLNLPRRRQLLKYVYTIIKKHIYPEYRNLLEYFTDMLKHVHTNHGVWALPNGDAYYAYMLKFQTTTDLTPEEIHQLGKQEVDKILNEMKGILKTEGLYKGTPGTDSVGICMQKLAKDPRFTYPNTDDGRKECLADFQKILDRSRTQLAHLFNLKPTTGVTIKQTPPSEQEGSAGAYYLSPSVDGSRPGMFYANLRNMDEFPKFGMETLTIHEAEPGHHFQLALQNEMDIPIMMTLGIFNANCEGWALYVEKLAYEEGFYSTPYYKLGHLQDELLRAVRLVIDTGIHYKRWTREYAIKYMQEITGYNPTVVVTEVERYFCLPGQACSYKVGQLKLLALRKEAKEKLGSLFDIREFHDQILRIGSVPLSVNEYVIRDWINRKLQKNKSK